jgi:hypothetical protein
MGQNDGTDNEIFRLDTPPQLFEPLAFVDQNLLSI